ncbi:MAG: adenylate/guanylate cyclase domain-containing protein [Ferruginibacter sp.]
MRQLAAIMFTDIVGYTALMGSDESNAFELLQKNRQLQQPIIIEFNGKLIKELGDGMLICFNTATDAVNAAVKVLNACNEQQSFRLRIGIHLAEVVFENNDVFGDGVNIASRIQSAAVPNSVYISEAVHHNIVNKKNFYTRFIKEEKLKNVKEPVKMFEVITDATVTSVKVNSNPATQMKSIAVLPFVNMSNDAEQDYFCDGISEEIINALAHINNLQVISRTSAFALKGKNMDVREIGKLLDVQSLLEGSVRKAGNRLRITTKLVNVSDGAHLWSDRYDREMQDIFAIQDDIAQNVVTALKGFLTIEEKENIKRPETIIEAYEYYLKGRQFFNKLMLQEAKAMFEKAIEADAGYALAYTGLADAYSWLYEWEGADASDLKAAEANSSKALQLAPHLSESHTSGGYALSLAKKYGEAEDEFHKAIQLNSNSFDAYYLFARSYFARGEIEKSVDMFRKASEVRREDYQSLSLLYQALKMLGKDKEKATAKESIQRARQHLIINPSDIRALSLGATTLSDIGEKEEAFEWINKAIKINSRNASVLLNATCLYAKSGQIKQALDLLEKAVENGFGNKNWITHDPDYDSLRDEPRFKMLMNKLK